MTITFKRTTQDFLSNCCKATVPRDPGQGLRTPPQITVSLFKEAY